MGVASPKGLWSLPPAPQRHSGLTNFSLTAVMRPLLTVSTQGSSVVWEDTL